MPPGMPPPGGGLPPGLAGMPGLPPGSMAGGLLGLAGHPGMPPTTSGKWMRGRLTEGEDASVQSTSSLRLLVGLTNMDSSAEWLRSRRSIVPSLHPFLQHSLVYGSV
jgi:hypothetical protein